MSFSHLPACPASFFLSLARCLDRRSALQLPVLLFGILFAHGRRTVTSWFRAAGITTEFRRAYYTPCTVGKHSNQLALATWLHIKPVLPPGRLTVGIDDTPTVRYGPEVEGAGKHHNPTPGPVGSKHLYGHVWVTLAVLAKHPQRDTIALPVQAQLYVRASDVPKLPPERRPPFRTKLELAVEQLQRLTPWVFGYEECWVAIDGGYSKKPFLRPATLAGWVVVGRLRKDAALFSVPGPKKEGQPGPAPTYGKRRLSLAKRAAHKEGWLEVECIQYGKVVTKTVKTFLATWHPAGGLIRVVLVKEEHGWVAFFCTKADATAAEILATAADRNAQEQMNKDVKEVWGAGQQQVRNLDSNVGCFNLNLWMYSMVEKWSWDKADEELVDRRASPWDSEPRRPSHADKRKALQREVLRKEIEAVLSEPVNPQRYRELAEKLLALAA
jgi:DDE superfamily endonuclease